MGNKLLDRKEILKCLSDRLESLDYVYGMWQCGSAAFERIDKWSDINIIVDVKDDKVEELFKVINSSLEELSPIESVFGGPQPLSQGAYQKSYKLKNTSKFMIVEVCTVKNSSSYKFLEKEIHGNIIIHFDKDNVTKFNNVDKKSFAQKLSKRIDNLEKFFNMYQYLIEKNIYRNNKIEALYFYREYALMPLVELLRIKYKPYRYNFKTRHIYYDLPKDIVNILHKYFFISDIDILKVRHEEVVEWFNIQVEELRKIKIEEIL